MGLPPPPTPKMASDVLFFFGGGEMASDFSFLFFGGSLLNALNPKGENWTPPPPPTCDFRSCGSGGFGSLFFWLSRGTKRNTTVVFGPDILNIPIYKDGLGLSWMVGNLGWNHLRKLQPCSLGYSKGSEQLS